MFKEWLLVFDVDDTLLGDAAALMQLNRELNEIKDKVSIALNSSRPIKSIRESLTVEPDLPRPDYVIGALGTEIEDETANAIERYKTKLARGWDKAVLVDILSDLPLEMHPDKYQTAFKLSYDLLDLDALEEVRTRVEEAPFDVKIIFSKKEKLDLIPESGGKGEAVEFLRSIVGVQPPKVVVAGDSNNDVDMFKPKFKGIVVANAEPALKSLSGRNVFKATKRNAGGVLEGLKHWNVL